MTINRVQRYYSLQAPGDDMAKKKAETEQTRKSKTDNANAKPSSPPAGSRPVADEYISTRTPDTTPVRNDRIEHARSMIKQGYYNDPRVVEEIINRLVQAIKE